MTGKRASKTLAGSTPSWGTGFWVWLETESLAINNTRDYFRHGHHQMVNTEIRLITFFVAKDGEAEYSQQNKTWS